MGVGSSLPHAGSSVFEMEEVPQRRATSSRPIRTAASSSASRRRRKSHLSKREPVREDFTDDESFDAAWHKWREDRDCNNQSVKRSRLRAKLRKQQESTTTTPAAGKSVASKRSMRRASPEPADSLPTMRDELHLLARYVSPQHTVSVSETRQATNIINKYLAEQRRGGGSE